MSQPPPHPSQSQGLHVGAEGELRALGAPGILLPYQAAWVADEAQVKVIEKSRRIGISWAEAGDAALHAATASGSDVYYLAYNLDMTRQFIEDCAWWARWYDLAAGAIEESVVLEDDRAIKVFEIRFASGHRIQALSSAPRNLRSKQGRVIFDEFAFHDAQDELLKAALALLIWGGEVRIISTHNSVLSAFYRLIQECRVGKRPFSVHRVTFREALAQGLYRRICLVKGEPWSQEAEGAWAAEIYAFYGAGAEEELDVVASQGSGRYLPRAVVEQCMSEGVPVVRLRLPDAFVHRPQEEREREVLAWCLGVLEPLIRQADAARKSVYGYDFGRSGDLSVLFAGQEGPGATLHTRFAAELRNVPFEQQRQILFFVAGALPRFMAGAHDARGNGSYLAEVAMQRFGEARVHQVQLSQPWYLDHFPPYKSALEDRAVVLPLDDDVLDDHSDVELVRGVPMVPQGKTRKGSDGGQRHGDAAIAALLMHFASRHAGAPIGHLSAGEREAHADLRRYLGEPDARPALVGAETGYGRVRGALADLDGYAR